MQSQQRRLKSQKSDTIKGLNASPQQEKKKSSGLLSILLGKKEVPYSTQDTIPYQNIFKDGICYLGEKKYNKQIEYKDINYQLAQDEEQRNIFELYCNFLNYFDPTIELQLSFINQKIDESIDNKIINIPYKDDEYSEIREEYRNFLKQQMTKGTNGIIKRKYMTFTIEADNLRTAKARLARVEADIISNLKVMGVQAMTLEGSERLRLLYELINQDSVEKFNFSWDSMVEAGKATKDYIAPSSINFTKQRTFQLGRTKSAVSYFKITAPEISDRLLADLLDIESRINISFHIKSIDQQQAIKNVKAKMSDINKMKIEEQKKAVRAGYDMDIIPPDLETYGKEAEGLLNDLQQRNERMFTVSLLIQNFENTLEKLENTIFQLNGIAQKHNCSIMRLDYMQEKGFVSCLPLGINEIEINRGLTTSSTAIFIPFTTQELFTEGEALYYGLNPLSNNMICADRKTLKNPNGLILGVPGSGKSFSAKREITNAFFSTDDDIIIVDPEAEYIALTEQLGGQVIKISQSSKNYINPLDINDDYSEDDDPLSLKSNFILSLMELIVGSRDGLDPIEKSIIDRCVRNIYKPWVENKKPENVPTLANLYEELDRQREAEAEGLRTALEIYVKGSFNIFNNQTNVDINKRVVCYDIKSLEKNLKKIGMLIVQDQIWNRVTVNRNLKKSTRSYIDEFHLLLKDQQTADYSVEIWKRFRKWGGIPTGLTQNVKDLLASREIENIFENSDFIYLLNQAPGDRQILSKQLKISELQQGYITNSAEGEGLIIFGSTIIPFVDKFPKHTKLYKIMTTKLEEAV